MSEDSGAAMPVERPFGGLGVDTVLAGILLFAGAILFLALAPSAYYAYLAIHVLSAVIWVGGDVTLTVLGIVFERRGEGETLGALGRMGAWIGTRVYTPTLVVTLVFGVILMEKGNFEWSQFWVVFALVGWAIAAVVGVGFVGPELGRIDTAARTYGPDSPEVAARVKRLFTIFRFDTALLILIVVNMAAKPSF
jgi:uncharacterized membrane protein